ncbi:MDR family MFS transporter [Candidatus Harpocratesius sp.]
MVITMMQKLKRTYDEFPKIFWMVTFISFIDMLGTYILMPFIALYVTSAFNVGLTQVGIIWTIVGIGNLFGGLIGGVLTDKFGRKFLILFGLIISASFSIVILFVKSINTFYCVVLAMGLMGSIAGPAHSAMVIDVLPSKKRTEGFGIMRISMNLAATIGPALGGFLSSFSFSYLFILDAVASIITGILFFFAVPETKQEKNNLETKKEKSKSHLGGYKEILQDWKFLLFVVVSAIMLLVYQQMNTTLPVFLRDSYHFPNYMYGWLLSMNAIMVVLFQYGITRRIKKFSPFIVMAVGNLLYAVGFGMYGLFSSVPLFFIAMVIITIGEMIVTPFAQTIAANFAPEDKRGRYMAILQWTGLIPTIFGVLGAGIVMDQHNPLIIWGLAFLLSIIAALGYIMLHSIMKYSNNLKNGSNLNQNIKMDNEQELIEVISSD